MTTPPTKSTSADFTRFVRPALASVLSAVMISLSVPPIGIFPLIYCAFIPVFYFLDDDRLSTRLKILYVIQHMWWTGLLVHFWVYYPLVEFGFVPPALGVVAAILFAFGANMELGVAGIAAALIPRHHKHWRPIVYLVIVCGMAYIPGIKLFPWSFADPQIAMSWLASGFFFVGRTGMLAFVFWVNIALWKIWRAIRAKNRAQSRVVARDIAAALIALALMWGGKSWWDHHAARDTTLLRVGLVQANIGNAMKLEFELGQFSLINDMVGRYQALTEDLLADIPPAATGEPPSATMVIWPETAYPVAFLQEPGVKSQMYDRIMLRWMQQHEGINFVFGTYGYADGARHRLQNQIAWVSSDGLQRRYGKRYRLAFGEYLPLRAHLPAWIVDRWPYGDFFVNPDPPEIWALWPGVRGLVNICYEVLFDDMTDWARRLDANLLINITNDSWFVVSVQKHLHLMMARVRSAITGLPMIRATNTGISATIDARGRVTHRMPADEPIAHATYVELFENPPQLPYFWLHYILAFIVVLLVAWRVRIWCKFD